MPPRRRARPLLHSDEMDTDDMFPMDSENMDDSGEWQPTVPIAPAAKKPRGRPRGSGIGSRGGRGRGAGRSRVPVHNFGGSNYEATSGSSVDEPNSLYEIVKLGKTSLQMVVDDWIESYKNDRDAALLDLMQFFIQCSGCKGKITPHMQATMEHAQIIRQMTEQFDEESGDYPLTMSGPLWKKFRLNFCEFVQVLVRQCQYSIIYDQYLMDNVISLLTGLSDSQVRAFRHTSTLAAMKLMTALVDVALNLSINLDNTQRQYESERQKNRDKRASERLEMLMQKRQELEENMEEIKNMLQYMFKSVFVHRYRDTLPEIRSICLTEIGMWMLKFHQMFLDDSYLKYIGWTLHDKVGDTRLKCLQALLPLYASDNLTGKLELFTNKFKDRIVAMTLDKEYDVAVQAVKLVISIQKSHREILTDKDCEHIYELVYSSHRAVAQAAGEFLNERLFLPNEDTVIKSKRGKKLSQNTPLVRDLVQFFIESELHEHGAYLVDSLIESNDMMKDWECMTDLLLEDLAQEDEPLDNRQETSLIEIMVCCVKQAATGDIPIGRGPNRRQLSAKEIKQIQDDKVKLTEHFINTLPLLLSKYIADHEKISNLMIIPQYMELEIYTTSRQEKNLDHLLALIAEIVEKHTDSDVLENCSKTYEALCTEELAIHSRCAVARGTLIDRLVNKYKEALEEYTQLGEEVNVDDVFAVTSSLKKISTFYNCHNLGPWGIWDGLYDIWIKCARDDPQRGPPEEIVKHALSSCKIGLCWELHVLEEHPYSERINNLKKKLHDYMSTLQLLMSHPNHTIQELSFLIINDLLIVFCKQMEGTQLHDLVFEPSTQLCNDLLNFIRTKVFIEEEESEDQDEHMKIEELHKRRSFLASFCKLIVYNILAVKHAAEVFKHYVKFYNDYGDIIKATLSKAREINKVNTARTMIVSLTSLFSDLRGETRKFGIINIDRQSEDFLTIKELGKRFALSFGLDPVRNREAVTNLHRMGIAYSAGAPEDVNKDPNATPANVAFLEILSEFTNKLVKQDKRLLQQFLDKRMLISSMPASSRMEDWQPLVMYRNSLVHGEQEQGPIKAPSRQYRGRKRQLDDVVQGHDDSNQAPSEHGSENDFDQGSAILQLSGIEPISKRRKRRQRSGPNTSSARKPKLNIKKKVVPKRKRGARMGTLHEDSMEDDKPQIEEYETQDNVEHNLFTPSPKMSDVDERTPKRSNVDDAIDASREKTRASSVSDHSPSLCSDSSQDKRPEESVVKSSEDSTPARDEMASLFDDRLDYDESKENHVLGVSPHQSLPDRPPTRRTSTRRKSELSDVVLELSSSEIHFSDGDDSRPLRGSPLETTRVSQRRSSSSKGRPTRAEDPVKIAESLLSDASTDETRRKPSLKKMSSASEPQAVGAHPVSTSNVSSSDDARKTSAPVSPVYRELYPESVSSRTSRRYRPKLSSIEASPENRSSQSSQDECSVTRAVRAAVHSKSSMSDVAVIRSSGSGFRDGQRRMYEIQSQMQSISMDQSGDDASDRRNSPKTRSESSSSTCHVQESSEASTDSD